MAAKCHERAKRFATALAVSLVAAAACDFTTEPVERLDLRVTVDRTVFAWEKALTIGFIAFNPTSDTIVFIEPHCHLLFEVRNSGGFVVAPEFVVCNSQNARFEIAPGDSLVKAFGWPAPRWCDSGACDWVPPGPYFVQSVIHTSDETVRSEAKRVEFVDPPG